MYIRRLKLTKALKKKEKKRERLRERVQKCCRMCDIVGGNTVGMVLFTKNLRNNEKQKFKIVRSKIYLTYQSEGSAELQSKELDLLIKNSSSWSNNLVKEKSGLFCYRGIKIYIPFLKDENFRLLYFKVFLM